MRISARNMCAAARQVATAKAPAGLRTSKLPNGLTIATLEEGSPVARFAYLCNSGSRYEKPETEGATTYLRNAAIITNERNSGFHISRSMHQLGCIVQCHTTREHMIYSAETTRDMSQYALMAITEMALFPWIQPHELDDYVNDKVAQEVHLASEDVPLMAMEALHKAAFRTGLGYGLYAPPIKTIPSYSSPWFDADHGHVHEYDVLQDFVDKHNVPANSCLVATGVGHEELVNLLKFEDNLPEEAGAPVTPSPGVFHPGQETRIAGIGPLTSASLAVAGAGLNSADLPAAALLQYLLGTTSNVKYGDSKTTSPVHKIIAGAASFPHGANSFNLSYSDAGLLGVSVACVGEDAGKIVSNLVKELPKLTFTEAQVKRAKAQLRGALMDAEDSISNQMQSVAASLLAGRAPGSAALLSAVDALSVDAVNAAAKKMLGSKMSLGVSGNLMQVPYLDQLQ